MKLLLLVLLLPAIAYAGLVTHYPCTNSYSNGVPDVPAWVEVEGCDEFECIVHEGDILHLIAAFAPQSTHHRLEFWVRVFLVGVPLPIEQPPGLDDACPLINGGCPIVAGQGETTADVYMEVDLPNIPIAVTVRAEYEDRV
uniref:MD-2-related lipid-recognition domain-containing protein n=1 Tax=Phlebotomus papatasi TaxID=29031 RepID=A0A1B0DI24_PHLPP